METEKFCGYKQIPCSSAQNSAARRKPWYLDINQTQVLRNGCDVISLPSTLSEILKQCVLSCWMSLWLISSQRSLYFRLSWLPPCSGRLHTLPLDRWRMSPSVGHETVGCAVWAPTSWCCHLGNVNVSSSSVPTPCARPPPAKCPKHNLLDKV